MKLIRATKPELDNTKNICVHTSSYKLLNIPVIFDKDTIFFSLLLEMKKGNNISDLNGFRFFHAKPKGEKCI